MIEFNGAHQAISGFRHFGQTLGELRNTVSGQKIFEGASDPVIETSKRCAIRIHRDALHVAFGIQIHRDVRGLLQNIAEVTDVGQASGAHSFRCASLSGHYFTPLHQTEGLGFQTSISTVPVTDESPARSTASRTLRTA